MRILHLALANFYVENFDYQENELSKQNKIDGHEVEIIASTEVRTPGSGYDYVKPCEFINNDGIKVIRIPYRYVLTNFITRKIRAYKGLYFRIEQFKPDVILFHGLFAHDLMVVARYKRNNPRVKFLCDCHAAFYNTNNSFFAKYVLHKGFYKFFLSKSYKYIDRIFYITTGCKSLLNKLYGLNDEKLSFLPLGGFIRPNREYMSDREMVRKKMSLDDSNIVLMHSGKLNSAKRSMELLHAFTKISNENLRLIIVGQFTPDVERKALELINIDKRILFLGWRSGGELIKFLCASDVYIQPGNQSNTMQNAICNRCAVALYPHNSHVSLLGDAFFPISNESDIVKLLQRFCAVPSVIENMKKKDWKIATEVLDYGVIAKKIYNS